MELEFKEKYTNVLKASAILYREGKYEKADWLLEQCRGDEISYRIGIKYPLTAQVALLMDKDLKYDEWVEYQAFRADIKAQVDNEIQTIKAEFNHGA